VAAARRVVAAAPAHAAVVMQAAAGIANQKQPQQQPPVPPALQPPVPPAPQPSVPPALQPPVPVMFSLAFLIQDLITCPHCPISCLYGKCCDFGMCLGGSCTVKRTGIRRAVANRSQPHLRSWLIAAISPGGRIPPGPNCHSLSERLMADSAWLRPMHAVI